MVKERARFALEDAAHSPIVNTLARGRGADAMEIEKVLAAPTSWLASQPASPREVVLFLSISSRARQIERVFDLYAGLASRRGRLERAWAVLVSAGNPKTNAAIPMLARALRSGRAARLDALDELARHVDALRRASEDLSRFADVNRMTADTLARQSEAAQLEETKLALADEVRGRSALAACEREVTRRIDAITAAGTRSSAGDDGGEGSRSAQSLAAFLDGLAAPAADHTPHVDPTLTMRAGIAEKRRRVSETPGPLDPPSAPAPAAGTEPGGTPRDDPTLTMGAGIAGKRRRVEETPAPLGPVGPAVPTSGLKQTHSSEEKTTRESLTPNPSVPSSDILPPPGPPPVPTAAAALPHADVRAGAGEGAGVPSQDKRGVRLGVGAGVAKMAGTVERSPWATPGVRRRSATIVMESSSKSEGHLAKTAGGVHEHRRDGAALDEASPIPPVALNFAFEQEATVKSQEPERITRKGKEREMTPKRTPKRGAQGARTRAQRQQATNGSGSDSQPTVGSGSQLNLGLNPSPPLTASL